MFLSRGGRDLGVAFQTHLRSQAWYIGEAKNSALLLSPNGYRLSPQSGLKGVRPPVEFEERPRDALQAILSRTQGYCYHLSKFHIYALVYCIGVFLSGLLHSV